MMTAEVEPKQGEIATRTKEVRCIYCGKLFFEIRTGKPALGCLEVICRGCKRCNIIDLSSLKY